MGARRGKGEGKEKALISLRARAGTPVVECARGGSAAACERGIMRVLPVEDYLPLQKAIAHGLRERGTAALDAEIRLLRWLLAGATGGALLLALLAGTLAIRRGLKPLDDLAARIAAIRQDDLSGRLPLESILAETVPVAQRLNELLCRLEEAVERERALAADVAHELRTPQAGVRSTLEVSLARRREVEGYRQAIEDCLEITGHMQAMVDNLLTLARLEGGQAALCPETVRLSELIESAWKPLARKAGERGLATEIAVPAELACRADRGTLAMILGNVLANSVQYADRGGRIEIAAARSGGAIELAVSNTGCGLYEEEAAHVFERFWRGDAARTEAGVHCGLGLALVRRRRRLHHPPRPSGRRLKPRPAQPNIALVPGAILG